MGFLVLYTNIHEIHNKLMSNKQDFHGSISSPKMKYLKSDNFLKFWILTPCSTNFSSLRFYVLEF